MIEVKHGAFISIEKLTATNLNSSSLLINAGIWSHQASKINQKQVMDSSHTLVITIRINDRTKYLGLLNLENCDYESFPTARLHTKARNFLSIIKIQVDWSGNERSLPFLILNLKLFNYHCFRLGNTTLKENRSSMSKYSPEAVQPRYSEVHQIRKCTPRASLCS